MPKPTEPRPKGGIEVIRSDGAKQTRRYSLWHLIFRRPLPLEQETTVFILVSALDVFMTYLLFRYCAASETRYEVETNPIAALFYHGRNMRGMVYFKFGLVAFVTVITQIIARERVELARKVLNLGTLIVSGVVIYTLVLLLRNTNIL